MLSENIRANKEFEEDLVIVKESLKKKRETQKKKIESPFFKFISKIFPNKERLFKNEFGYSGHSELQKELKLESIYSMIKKEIDVLTTKGTDNTSIFGLYDVLIRKLIRKEVIYIELNYIICTLISIINFGCFYDLVDSMTGPDKKELELTSYFIIMGLVIFLTILFRFLTEIRTRMEFTLTTKIKQTLTIMVYNKLIVSDHKFLTSCDNSTIHKLFYWYSQDYASYNNDCIHIFKFFAWWIIYLHSFLFKRNHSVRFDFMFYLGVGCLSSLIIVASGLLKVKQVMKLKEALLSEREITNEIVDKFKTLPHTPFISIFSDKLSKVVQEKMKLLHKIAILNGVPSLIRNHLPYLVLLFFFSYLLAKNFNYLVANGKIGTEHTGTGFLSLASVVSHLIMYPFISTIVTSSADQAQARIRKNKAKKFYDQFLTDDFVIQGSIVSSQDLRLGEVILENCDIFERENSETIKRLMTIYEGSPLKKPVKFKVKKDLRILPSPIGAGFRQNNGANTRVHPKPIDSFEDRLASKANSSNLLQQVCQNLSLKLLPGTSFCVLWSASHSSAIKGFVNLLIGENHLRAGTIRMNGHISLLSKERNPLLVGKTIRDNILFGQQYLSERYEQVLNIIGTKFERYKGKDFYQVREKASNIHVDDATHILLARFLYKESSIYVVEDLLIETNYFTHELLLEKAFRVFLRGKTLIYVTAQKEMILWATQMIKFRSNYRYQVYNGAQVHDFVAANPKLTGGSKTRTLKGKIKNSIFIANTSFEEELAIHKKIEREKQEIEKKKELINSRLEKISYGFYLAQKRRTEGQNIKGFSSPKSIDFLMSIKKYWRIGHQNGIGYDKKLVLILKTLYRASLIIVEYLLIVKSFKEDTFEPEFHFNIIIAIISLIVLSALIHGLNLKGANDILEKIYLIINKNIHRKLLNSSYSFVMSLMRHDVLGYSSEEMQVIQFDLRTDVVAVFDNLLDLVLYSMILLFINSLVLPLVVLSIYYGFLYYSFMKLQSRYIKSIAFTHFTRHKKDEFNFQLLNLIFGYRVSNAMQKLNTKFLRLSDNLVRNEKLILVDYKMLFLRLNSLIQMFVVICFMSFFIIFIKYPSFNFFGFNKALLLWSIPIAFRLVVKVEDCMLGLLSFLFHILDAHKVMDFIEEGNSSHLEQSKLTSTTRRITQDISALQSPTELKLVHKPDFTKILTFKNVSLTLGYQPILKKITFSVKSGQRIGVLGVDGGGRTSLFDLILGLRTKDEKQTQTSSIKIFGIPIEYLSDAQKMDISIIPREPQVFEGTVRSNIDPLCRHEDSTIISLLEKLRINRVLYKELFKKQITLKSAKVEKTDERRVSNRIETVNQPSQQLMKEVGTNEDRTHASRWFNNVAFKMKFEGEDPQLEKEKGNEKGQINRVIAIARSNSFIAVR